MRLAEKNAELRQKSLIMHIFFRFHSFASTFLCSLSLQLAKMNPDAHLKRASFACHNPLVHRGREHDSRLNNFDFLNAIATRIFVPLLLDQCTALRVYGLYLYSTLDIYIIDYTFHGNLCVKSITICVVSFSLSLSLALLETSQTKKCFSFGILILISFASVCAWFLARFDIQFWFCLGSLVRHDRVSDCHQKWWMLLQVSVNNLQQSISNRFFCWEYLLHYSSFVFATVNIQFCFSSSESIGYFVHFFGIVVSASCAAAAVYLYMKCHNWNSCRWMQ